MIKFHVADEMQKLRDYLDSNKIEWDDASSIDDFWVCRTHFWHRGYKWSVINGMGTYGGVEISGYDNNGKLEMMVNCVDKGEPVGWLIADEVIKYIEGGKW